jgi:DNA-binding beta-propeller fold protein YncE
MNLPLLTVLGAAAIALPGGPPVGMDYLVYDEAHHRLWVPAGNTGSVDVIDTVSGKVTPIGGFVTIGRPGAPPSRPKMGPSSATVGDDVVWVGNRGDNQICGFDRQTLTKKACVKLAAMPDGVTYVKATHELWVTTPREQALAIVNVGHGPPAAPVTVKLEGAPEGYAVDEARGLFYTNLEDQGKTLAIDAKSRKVVSTFSPGCNADGPRGLAFDGARRHLFVACTDGAVSLDAATGRVLGRVKTGNGVDNIDYHPKKQRLYVASRDDATLTIARVAEDGTLSIAATAPTGPGARNAVVDENGTAYVADSAGGRIVVVKVP